MCGKLQFNFNHESTIHKIVQCCLTRNGYPSLRNGLSLADVVGLLSAVLSFASLIATQNSIWTVSSDQFER